MSNKNKKPAAKISMKSIGRLLKFLFKDYPAALCMIGVCIVVTAVIGIMPSVYIKTITSYIVEGLSSGWSSIAGDIAATIFLMIALYIGEGKKLYTLSPDFSMYDYYVGMHNGTVVRYPRKAEETFDTEDFIAKGKAEKVDLVLFSNPNNPTGQIIKKKDLCRIAAAFDCPVIIDEAYGEFADDTMIDQLDRYENLFVTRTLSKAFALAAVRCGFLIGNKAAMKKIRSCKVPYNVNTMTQCAAQIVLSNRDELLKRRDEIIQERSRMEQACARYDTDLLRIYPSHANFFYGRSSRKEELWQTSSTLRSRS